MNLSIEYKRIVVLINDILISIFCTWLALSLRLDQFFLLSFESINFFLLPIVLFIPIFFYSSTYSAVFRYFGIDDIIRIFFNTTIYGISFLFIIILIEIEGFPRSIGIIQPIFFFIIIVLSRITAATIIQKIYKKTKLNKLLIYGAGSLGFHASNQIASLGLYEIIAFIDDDKRKVGKRIEGKIIYHSSNLRSLIKQNNITHILVAISSLSNFERRRIFEQIDKENISIKMIPSIKNLIEGNLNFSHVVDINRSDILDREIIIDNDAIGKNLLNKVVLVTGAGGSIGSELCTQIIFNKPKQIILFDHSEINLYSIDQKVSSLIKKHQLSVDKVSILGSVRDLNRLDKVLKENKPQNIFHAAAYKHVPIVEENITEAIINNFFGTINLIEAANNHNCSSLVLVSTDKAVRPTNIMGASKRLAEIYLQAFSNHNVTSNMILSIVRFGNVLDSSGSVIPVFREQIKEGGPITVTHPEITRYFMTIPEAVGLILQSTTMSNGGEVFVLNMGKPVKIVDLAKKMIKISGLKEKSESNPNGQIEIVFTGLRAGEKMHEELFISDEFSITTHKDILYVKEDHHEYHEILSIKDKLEKYVLEENIEEIIRLLKKEIKGFKTIKL